MTDLRPFALCKELTNCGADETMQKERYFTPETIVSKTAEMLAALDSFRRKRAPFSLKPSRAALLILDMQGYFLRSDSHAFIPSARAILPNIRALLDAFRARSRPVVFTRHVNTVEDAGMMGKWWRDLIARDSPLSEIVSELRADSAPVVEKSQYDAFWKTNLDDLLHSTNTELVVVTGVMTHLCCETTARSAFVRGYEVFFTADATAAYDEAHHRAALLNLAHGFALPVSTGEVLRVFES